MAQIISTLTKEKLSVQSFSPQQWQDWRWQLAHRISRVEELEQWIDLTPEERAAAEKASQIGLRFAMTPYFASILDKKNSNCPLRRQVIPDSAEFVSSGYALRDPCGEEKDTISPGLVKRYPDRVLFLVTDACAAYCRHCTRRRIVGEKELPLTNEQIDQAINYIQNNPRVRDVLLSGGDPLLLSDNKLNNILERLRRIKHVEIIRIGSRLPVTLPQRITTELVGILRRYHPLYLSIHFNHPAEITPETASACNRLSDGGIPLGSQTVLLRGINDDPEVMRSLMHKLLQIRVRPYYLYQCDLAIGIDHFRTPVKRGLEIIRSLRGFTTGYAIPTYVIDAPKGGGKVPLSPNYVVSHTSRGIFLRNFQKRVYFYPDENSEISGDIEFSNERR